MSTQWGFVERIYRADKGSIWMTPEVTQYVIMIIIGSCFIGSYQNLCPSCLFTCWLILLPLSPDCEFHEGKALLPVASPASSPSWEMRKYLIEECMNKWFLRLLSILSQRGLRLRLVYPQICFFKKTKIFLGGHLGRKRNKRKGRHKTIFIHRWHDFVYWKS